MEIITQSAEATQKFGKEIGHSLKQIPSDKQARIVLLKGELGSGKTTFMQGVAKAFGIPYRVVSPTYIFIKDYEITESVFQKLYHIDLYRIQGQTVAESLGLTEIFTNPKAIVCLEWPERLKKLPETFATIEFSYVNDTERKIRVVTKELELSKELIA